MGNCVSPKLKRREVFLSRSSPQVVPPQGIDWSNTIPYIVPVNIGRVIKVYDGDTITIATYLYGSLYRFPVRLAGIDTPEMKSRHPNEKQLAMAAQCALNDLLLHKIVNLENVANEKYGRLLADVFVDGVHVNKWMIDNQFAVPYDGGTKTEDWSKAT